MTVLRPALCAGLFVCAGPLAALPGECFGQEQAAETAAAAETAPTGETPAAADVDYRDVFARVRSASLTWDDPGTILREFLTTADDGVLERMRADDDNDIAFTAAWESIRRTAREDEPTPRWVDAAALNRFVGFVEGRLRVPPPPEWTEGVLSAWVTPQKVICFARVKDAVDVETGGWRVSGVDDARVVEGKLRITVAGHDLTCPFRGGGHFGSQEFVSAAHDGRRCYVAHFASEPLGSDQNSCWLYCLDLESGEREWVRTVRVTLLNYQLGNSRAHRVWIVPRKKSVVLFGLRGSGAYIEVFRRSDGRNLYRFCTDLEPRSRPPAEEE